MAKAKTEKVTPIVTFRYDGKLYVAGRSADIPPKAVDTLKAKGLLK